MLLVGEEEVPDLLLTDARTSLRRMIRSGNTAR